MKLELPDNNASVLFHMGNALQSIARDIDTSLPVNGHTETVGDVSRSVTVEPTTTMSDVTDMVKASLDEALNSGLIEPLTTQPEAEFTERQAIDHMSQPTDTIDKDGLPWDQRIHSRGKTRLADNTWRMARKPNDKTDEEWAEYVEGVKTELRALMVIPVATGAELDVLANIPVITAEQRAELKVHVDAVVTPPVVDAVVTPPVVDAVVTPPVVDAVVTPPVIDAVEHVAIDFEGVTSNGSVAIVPPPSTTGEPAIEVTPPVVDAVVTPPVVDTVVTPPVVDAVVTGPTTFPELMKFITVNNKKLTKESVDEALKAQGLASIALLAARTDLIPQVHAALVELL